MALPQPPDFEDGAISSWDPEIPLSPYSTGLRGHCLSLKARQVSNGCDKPLEVYTAFAQE